MSLSRRSEWQVSYRDWQRQRWRDWGQAIHPTVRKFGVFFLIGTGGLGLYPSPVGLWSILPLAVVGLIAQSLAYGPSYREQIKRERLSELDEFDPLTERWFIDLTLTDGNAVAGEDVGVLWFEDGRMHFVGQFCSFSLKASDLALEKYALDRWVEPSALTLPITERGYCGYRCLVMREIPLREATVLRNRPLRDVVRRFAGADKVRKASDPPPAPRDSSGVRSAAWYAISGETATGTIISAAEDSSPSQFPPLGLGPGAHPKGPRWLAGRLAIWFLSLGSLYYAFVGGGTFLVMFFPGMLAIVERDAIDSFRDFRVLKWRDRQKARQLLATDLAQPAPPQS